MTPQQLKNAILQQAIQGKLVEQRAEEGTGEELYKAIQDEKQKLIQEGKLKKQKALPEITEDEIPFEIPETWKWVSVGLISNIINGDRGKNYPSKSKLTTKGIPFISAVNLDGTTVIENENLLCLTNEQYDKLGSGKLEQGDIVLCIRGSIGKHGRYPFKKGAIASSLVILRPYLIDEKLINYLMKYLDSSLFFSEIKKYDNGTAQPNLSAKNLGKFLIPLPPLAEQKRIVEKIEELLPLVERYEKAWTRLEELNKKFPLDMKKAILGQAIQGKLVEQRAEEGTSQELYKAIQDEKQKLIQEGKLKKQKALPEITEEEIPFEIPETWKWVRLGDIVNFSIGKTPPRAEAEWWGNDLPWVSISDMSDYGFIKSTKEKVSKKAVKEKFVKTVSKETLLMSFKLTVGRTSILKIDAVHNEAIISIVPLVDNKYSFRDMLFYVLPIISQWGESKNAIKGKTLNTTSINNLLITLPPLAEQKRIVEKIEELLPLVEKLK